MQASAVVPHLLRSHKYGGVLMTMEQFRNKGLLAREFWQTCAAARGHVPNMVGPHVLNRVRFAFNAASLEDVRPVDAGAAIELLRLLRAAIEAEVERAGRLTHDSVRRVVQAGTPWTPWIHRRARARLGRNPDWNAARHLQPTAITYPESRA